jgi:hypothetical protein
MNGSEAPALQLNGPPGSDPQPILLVPPPRPSRPSPALGEEGVDAAEAADTEHAHPGEVLG